MDRLISCTGPIHGWWHRNFCFSWGALSPAFHARKNGCTSVQLTSDELLHPKRSVTSRSEYIRPSVPAAFFSSAFITNNNHIKCVLQLSAVFATTSLGPAAAPTSPTLWTLLQEKTGALASPLTMPRSTVTHQEQVPGLPKLRHQNRRCSIC